MSETYKIRLDPEQRERWEVQAKSERLSLAEWIRRACDGALGEPGGSMPSVPMRAEGEPRGSAPGSPSVPSFVLPSVVPGQVQTQIRVPSGKRSYEPDPR